jgi:hypothetical protein
MLVLLAAGAGLVGWQLRKELSPAIPRESAVTAPPSVIRKSAGEGPAKEGASLKKAEPGATEPQDISLLSGGPETKADGIILEEQKVLEEEPGQEEGGPYSEAMALATLEDGTPVQEEPAQEPASLFLNEQGSVGELFRVFYAGGHQAPSPQEEVHLGLYTIEADPEHYALFKKPFLIRVAPALLEPTLVPTESGGNTISEAPVPQYLLIHEVTPDGAIAIDGEGQEHLVTREFLLAHWGYEVSWIYPFEDDSIDLIHGMFGPEVIELQRRLNDAGYWVEITGIYDDPTFEKVVRLQTDFRLLADGIVGQRTKGLLYQLSN